MNDNHTLETRLRQHLLDFLDVFLGEGYVEGHNMRYGGAISVVVDQTHPQFGAVFEFKVEQGAGPLRLLKLAGISETEAIAWLDQQDDTGTADQAEPRTSSKPRRCSCQPSG